MTDVERLARFVVARSWDDLSEPARDELKIRILDGLGCALGARDASPVAAIRAQLEDFGGSPLCTLIGGGASAPDRAVLYNGALVRYLDFNDSYIPTQGATGSKVYLTVPVSVASTAQIPAGWALYNSLPSYPNFVGMAGLLTEGIDTWLTPYVISGSTSGWVEGNAAMVMDNGDGTYTVHNITLNSDIVIDHPTPLASAAVW